MSSKIGPWTRLSTRELYENPWISVREDQVLHPDGSPGIFGVVHYRFAAVAVIPVDAEGRVTLVGQHRYGINAYTWEIPQGGCPEGDELQTTAVRELREETGYTAARWDYLGKVAVSDSITDEIGHAFLARDLTPGMSDPEGSEQLQTKSLDLEDAYAMAMDGRLSECMTIIGLARAIHFLRRERGDAERQAPSSSRPASIVK
jgi:8-oxo-dGTP pyrophosphatase MutT (NUDIX family)